MGKCHPSDFGQLVFYVNALDRLEKKERDDPTIGLLLCKDADKFVAETTLKIHHPTLVYLNISL